MKASQKPECSSSGTRPSRPLSWPSGPLANKAGKIERSSSCKNTPIKSVFLRSRSKNQKPLSCTWQRHEKQRANCARVLCEAFTQQNALQTVLSNRDLQNFALNHIFDDIDVSVWRAQCSVDRQTVPHDDLCGRLGYHGVASEFFGLADNFRDCKSSSHAAYFPSSGVAAQLHLSHLVIRDRLTSRTTLLGTSPTR